MRSAFIVATITLSVLAAPVPEAKSIEQKGGALCIEHSGPACFGTWETQTETRSLSSEKGVRDVEESKESVAEYINQRRDAEPEPINRGANARRSAEPEPFSRGSHPRSAEPFSRGSHARSAEPFSRGSHPRSAEPFSRGSHARSAEPFSRGSHPSRSVEGPGSVEVESKVEDTYPSARREADPVNRINGREPEPVNRINGREPFSRPNHDSKRSPAPGRVRWGGRSVCQPELDSNHCGTQEKRSIDGPVNDDGHHAGAEAVDGDLSERAAEAEPVVTGPGAGAGQLCLKGGRWVRC